MLHRVSGCLLFALALAGCSNNPEVTPPPPDYYLLITITPPGVTMPAGGEATISVIVTRDGLYPGTVTLSAEGLPINVTGVFQPAALTGNLTQSTLTVAANVQAALGSFTFVIRARGADVDDVVTSPISVVVTPP
jgi:hypothetical protein